MFSKYRKRRGHSLNEPLRHESHKRPVTRRDFLAQGFMTGAATLVAPTALGMLLNPQRAQALTSDLGDMRISPCRITAGAGKIPFICFDLAGGANIAGSNVLVGQALGQLDFLSAQGYSKLGLPGEMAPTSSTSNFINTELGLAFHSDSAFLRGILEKTSPSTRARINGAVIPARSENDTANNPHNPMYGIAKAGAKGQLLTLIGSQNSESGGNSIAPAALLDPANRPTKVDRTSDVTGLVDTGQLGTLFPDSRDTVAVLESMARLSQKKLNVPAVSTQLDNDADVKTQVKCAYIKTADLAERFSDPAALNPAADPDIRGPAGVFTAQQYDGEREFEKTGAVMKLVVNGFAGAGTVSMGGFDYHTGDRATGELRDLRAGRCMGACLEYAARRNKPLMMYVFSDGSLSSNGQIDNSVDGRGKGQWTGDNQQTGAAFFLIFDPAGRPTLLNEGGIPLGRRQQLGYFRRDGDVETAGSPAANNVNLLVQTVLLNYMALHGEAAAFSSTFGNGLGLPMSAAQRSLIAFNPIVNGVISS